jgi:predicted Zn-dependent protease
MKATALVLAAVFVTGAPSSARAQLGALGKIKRGVDKAADAKQKYDDYNVTDKEERQLGEQVSLQLRDRFGVYQNQNVTKYVTLVGTLLAKASSRPNLDWQFIVLDTDGVNAYAAPGGIVHITRGLLGLMKNEAELAGVLGHEVTHVTEKHTVEAIKQEKKVNMVGEAAGSGGGLRDKFLAQVGAAVFNKVFEGEFSQKDENEADRIGTRLANGLGYLPSGIADVLKKIDARNGGRDDRNGMFASHPATKDRIAANEKLIASEKLSGKATADARYKSNITFDAKPVTEISGDVAGAAGLAGSDKKKEDDTSAKKADEPKKKGGIGSALGSISGNKQQASTQQASSAGARGVGGAPDRDAKGGANKSTLTVKVTPAELDAFKKGIAG